MSDELVFKSKITKRELAEYDKAGPAMSRVERTTRLQRGFLRLPELAQYLILDCLPESAKAPEILDALVQEEKRRQRKARR